MTDKTQTKADKLRIEILDHVTEYMSDALENSELVEWDDYINVLSGLTSSLFVQAIAIAKAITNKDVDLSTRAKLSLSLALTALCEATDTADDVIEETFGPMPEAVSYIIAEFNRLDGYLDSSIMADALTVATPPTDTKH